MPWLLPILYFALDVLFGRVGEWNVTQWFYYLLSLAASLALWFLWWRTVRGLRRHRPHLALAIAILGGTIYGVNLVLVYGYAAFVGVMPNFYTFEYVFDEPYSSWMFVRDSLTAIHMLLFLPVSGLFAWWLYGRRIQTVRAVPRLIWSRWVFLSVLLFFVTAQLVLHNNARFVDQCFAADITTSTNLARSVSVRLRGPWRGSSGLLARVPQELPDLRAYGMQLRDGRPVNVLILLTESVRADGFSAYGYTRQTTPFFDSVSVSDSQTVFLFERAFTNASRTRLSMPSLLNGVSPIQPARLLHSQPVIWEYFRAMGYQTFFITSQSHDWCQMKNFFAVAGIDHLFNEETSGQEFWNASGIHDEYTFAEFKRWIEGRDTARGFAGVLQLHGTHYPYWAPDSLRIFGEATDRDRYDNSMRTLDGLIRDVFDFLRAEGLAENTLIVLTSDHGEEFREHGIFGHTTSYYRNTLWIPMLWVIPEEIQGRALVGEQMQFLAENTQRNVSNIDILPTILDCFGLTGSEELAPILANLSGQSVLDSIPDDRPVIACNNSEINRIPMGLTMVLGNWHYIFNIDDQHVDREELYDWTVDRAEIRNVFADADPRLVQTIYAEFARHQLCVGIFALAGMDLSLPANFDAPS
jgi:glucan phosphoethanolaminetransferase (alkaline phosphatase superfamily)